MTDALVFSHFDPATRPQDDLFRHVTGGWLKTATIDDDKASAGSFVDLRDASEQAVREIVEQLDLTALEAGSEPWKVAQLHATFMDEDAIEARGAEPLAPIFERIDAISTVADLLRYWGWSQRVGLSSIVGFGVDADPGQPQRPILFAGQSGLGLPDEEYYRLPEHEQIRGKYRDYLERAFELAGFADAAEQATTVLELETRIAGLHWDKVRVRDIQQMYNPMTWQQFNENSALDWNLVVEGMAVDPVKFAEVVNEQPSFFAELPSLIDEQNLAAWKSWARRGAITGLSSFLSSDFVNARFDFYDKTLMGVPALRPRWKRSVSLIEGVMGEAVGKLYVDKHFPPAAKERMDELVDNLLKAYHSSIEKLDWMGEDTRKEALDKLAKFRPKIGYPDKWRDYSGLEVTPGDLVRTVQQANEFGLEYELAKLGQPIDREEWFMTPQTVNAYYHPLRNEIVFPAAILQPPFFNVDADDAVNYGGIGAVIGHEIGHGFDDQGSTCDGDGRLRDWWTQDDRDAFEQRTASLIGQFDVLVPEQLEGSDVHVNGALTIGENIGDLGGVSIALKAWRIATGGQVEPIDDLTGEQRFFLSYAAIWQTKIRDEALKQRIATDPHAPSEFRCNQIVRNVDDFYTAFDVSTDDQLWLEQDQRVTIW